MGTEEYVKFIFSKMMCSCCDQQFTPDCVDIIRIEGNCAIVKIQCTHCETNYGIAIIGIETIQIEQESTEKVLIPDLPAITLDDVLSAHDFIEKLDADWTKYIPDKYKLN